MSEPLRLLAVIDGFGIGGAERALLRFIEALDGDKFETSVFNTGVEGPMMDDYRRVCHRVVSRPKRRAVDLALIGALAKTTRETRADVVFSVLYYADIIAGLAQRRTGVPTVAWQHMVPTCDTKNNRWYHRLAFRLAQRGFTRIVCCADCVRDDIIEVYGLAPRRVCTVHNGVNLERFVPAPLPRRDDFVIGLVGRFAEQKGHVHLLRALPAVFEALPNARVSLVGDGPLRPAMETLAAELGVSERVTFAGATDEVVAAYQSFDVSVLPSLFEAHPLAVLEAMACGRTVIASDLPGVREAFGGQEVGLLFPIGDSAALAKALIELGNNRARCATLGAAARKRVEQAFDGRTQQTALLNVVLQAAGRGEG